MNLFEPFRVYSGCSLPNGGRHATVTECFFSFNLSEDYTVNSLYKSMEGYLKFNGLSFNVPS